MLKLSYFSRDKKTVNDLTKNTNNILELTCFSVGFHIVIVPSLVLSSLLQYVLLSPITLTFIKGVTSRSFRPAFASAVLMHFSISDCLLACQATLLGVCFHMCSFFIYAKFLKHTSNFKLYLERATSCSWLISAIKMSGSSAVSSM